MKNWMKYLIVTLIVALLTNGAQFYFIKEHIATVKEGYEKKIDELNATLAEIGTFVDVYTVRSETEPGMEVKEDSLDVIQIPTSAINDSFVLEKSQIVGKYHKLALQPGVLLTDDMFMGEEMDDTMRETDLIADIWSVGLKEGDYVDLEITYPYGDSYVVLSHVRVHEINTKTLKTYLNSRQRHIYSGALVDYYINSEKGAALTLVKYPEPGVQEAAEVTYSLRDNILSIITEDPNVAEKIDLETNKAKRTIIEHSLATVTDEDASLLSSGRKSILGSILGATDVEAEETKKAAEERQEEEKRMQQTSSKSKKQPNPGNLNYDKKGETQ